MRAEPGKPYALWLEKQREDGAWKNKMYELYKKLDYRERLLFMSVVHFLTDNPKTEEE